MEPEEVNLKGVGVDSFVVLEGCVFLRAPVRLGEGKEVLVL